MKRHQSITRHRTCLQASTFNGCQERGETTNIERPTGFGKKLNRNKVETAATGFLRLDKFQGDQIVREKLPKFGQKLVS